MSEHDPLVYELQARVKELEGELRTRYAWRLKAEAAEARVKELKRMDSEAATYVESVICMRTDFTGEPPYVGWKGLGLALNEALDKRDAAEARVKELEAALEVEGDRWRWRIKELEVERDDLLRLGNNHK